MQKKVNPIDWAESLFRMAKSVWPIDVVISGKIDKHIGPTFVRASASASLSPCDVLKIDIPDFRGDEFEGATQFSYGILDVLLLREGYGRVLIAVKHIDVHPIDSSPWAFRLAGRAAAGDALEQLVDMRA